MKITYSNPNLSEHSVKNIESSYVFDSNSNLKLFVNSSSVGNNIAMDFIGYNPNQSVISEFYDVEFTELKPVNVLVVTPSTSIPTETSTQVSSTIIIDNPSTISDSMMTRDVIVKLRIGLGEGRNSDDFSTTFPYGKIT
jgi:hypothetical protein